MVIQLNPQNFKSEVVDADMPVIVDFWAPWCGPCQMMAPVFEKLSKEFEGKVKFAKINVDDYGEVGAKYGVMGIPSLVIFDGDREIGRIVGYNPESILKQRIEAVL